MFGFGKNRVYRFFAKKRVAHKGRDSNGREIFSFKR